MNPNFEQIPNDRGLVRRLLDGDEEAYDELFAEHFAGLMRFALSRLGGDEELAPGDGPANARHGVREAGELSG